MDELARVKNKYKVTVRSSPRWIFFFFFLQGNPPATRVTSNEKHKHGLLFYTSDSWSIMGGNFRNRGLNIKPALH